MLESLAAELGEPDGARAEQRWNRQVMSELIDLPHFRVWTYRQAAIVLGCSQRKMLETAQTGAATAVLGTPELLLRESGGGAVLCGPWMLGVSVALPIKHRLLAGRTLPDSYRWLGELHADWLCDYGAAVGTWSPAAISAQPAADRPEALRWACFAGASPWEVGDASMRKIVGLAQRRTRYAALFVAGTLIEPPAWGLMTARLQRSADLPRLAALTIDLTSLIGHAVDRKRCADDLHLRLAQKLQD
jgi:lipoate---protein ligase